ncbi:GNAT family N-acetyltransferase [Vibrio fluminensis]|uniref:GNAT family N-acetyltransferase n=1 Tax=Vibrio fluminensis TaxID=2783614 RepID=UPI0018878F84|nr:GNAT family N-acetyltransferase [Vibrio fluminensis]
MKVITATINDLESIVPLFDAYRVFYSQTSDVEKARDFLQERLSNNESIIFLAIDADNNAVGFTQLFRGFSSVSAARTWILNDLYVIPTARGLGVAKRLMNAARELAECDKVKGLALETAEDNLNAQKLYESLGYQRELGTYHYFLSLD